jgi:membrane-bound ClpP family serine protease
MNSSLRPLLAVVLMSVGLVALVIDGVDHGWSALAAVGAACFAIAIASELLVLRRARSRG